jgi:sarcosine oxidase subunit beta
LWDHPRVDRADVVVVGAGVVGLSCARELRRLGAGSVVVLEALPAVGEGSSSRANGGVRAQFSTAPNIAFSRWSIDELEALDRATGRLAFHQTGYLLLTGTEEGEARLRASYELQRSHGVETRWLEPDEAVALAPFVRADGLRAATFHDRDGFLDPAGLVAALATDAQERGAIVRTDAPVATIRQVGTGFELEHGGRRILADIVVNAAGSDAREVATMVGAEVPVDPVRRNLALVLDPSAAPTLSPMCVDLDTGVLARREVAGGWVVAYSDPRDPPGRETSVDPAFLTALAERVPNRFPFLADLPLDPARCWAGLYPETSDHHAIVGTDPSVPGVIHCAGFGGHGVMHAPAAGRAVAELVTLGRCTTFDLDPLRPGRFAEGDVIVEGAVF